MEKNKEFSIEIDQNELQQLKDPFNANVEVAVTFNDGLTVTVIVGTTQNLEYQMTKTQSNYYEPGLPWIIVKELTPEIINEAIEGYLNSCPNGYWLKLYYFWNDLDITIFDSLDPIELDESIQLNLSIRLEQLETEFRKHYKAEEAGKLNLVTKLDKSLILFETLKSNSEKLQFQLSEQLTLTEKYLNSIKALLLFMSLLLIIQVFHIFWIF